MTKHTQGPWTATKNKTVDGDIMVCVVAANVITVIWQAYDNPENEANGRLIAAAPELLEALSELVAMNNCNYDRALMQKAFEKAQSAINKAKGE